MKIPIASPDLSELERRYVVQAMESGWISSKGEFIQRFEEAFASYIGVKHAISTSSGTSALQLAYIATMPIANVQITVPDNTFIATQSMAHLISSNVHVIPVDRKSWNLAPASWLTLPGIVCGVHLYGNPMELADLPKFRGIFIEDCAQAIGSEYRGKRLGSFGLASIFSFYGNKTLTTGEGGMVCTSDDTVADRVRSLRNHCMTEPYIHTGIGFNAKMTNLQAALGLAQLERIEEFCAKKVQITQWYERNLSRAFERQRLTRGCKVVKWMNAYRHKKAGQIRQALAQVGIETRPGFVGSDTIVFPSGSTLTQAEVEAVCKVANVA